MGLLESSEQLVHLARSRAPADRDRMLMALIDLCEAGPGAASHESVQQLLTSIFVGLVVEAERDLRRRLAEKLAHAVWAPPGLINILALDDIEIAGPIIAASPVLKDDDLIRLLLEATIEHQIEVARRPKLGRPVVAAILRQGEPAVLTALAGNTTAELDEDGMRQLVAEARRVAALRTPLSRHPKLTSDLALELYVWLGQAMRQSLVERFRLDAEAIEKVLAETVQEAHAGLRTEDEGMVVVARDGEREEMERALVEKLHAAGELRMGYLVRSLREGRLGVFTTALARLGDFTPRQMAEALDSPTEDLLQAACTAVNIDRSVFPTILELVRGLNDGRPGAEPAPMAETAPVARRLSIAAALRKLRPEARPAAEAEPAEAAPGAN